MHPHIIKDNIYFVGSIDWDRKVFDELIELPLGTSYNSYLIKGKDKTALIDTVDPSKEKELLSTLKQLQISKLDYIICNHGEQDHSGAIPAVLNTFPESKVVTNAKCRDLIISLLRIPEDRIITIKDGETLSLGDKTLQFILAPWVHWPETMLTYLQEDKILFPCDLFGSHIATSDLWGVDRSAIYLAAKRYYAEIMMPFRSNIIGHLEKLKNYQIEIIAPSHGVIYKDPQYIINAYKEWSSDQVKNLVLIPYVSMHGSVAKMVEHLTKSLIERGVEVRPFNLGELKIGELAMALVDAATVVLGTPAVLVGPHPNALYGAYLVNALRPKTKYISLIGSYGWGSKVIDIIKSTITNVKAEFIEPVFIKGYPAEQDLKAIENLAENILIRHKENKLL